MLLGMFVNIFSWSFPQGGSTDIVVGTSSLQVQEVRPIWQVCKSNTSGKRAMMQVMFVIDEGAKRVQ